MIRTLTESILAKCQRDRWYGPDYYNPRRFQGFPAQDFDAFPDEEGNFPVRIADPEQNTSPLPLTDPEQIRFV